MARIKLTVTKYGKGRFILNRESVNKLLKASRATTISDEFISLTIRGKSFPLRIRKDGRATIPAGVVRKSKIKKKGDFFLRTTRPKRNQVYVQRKTYRGVRTRNIIKSRFFYDELDSEDDDVSMSIADNVRNKLFKDIMLMERTLNRTYGSGRAFNFYARLYFQVVGDSGEIKDAVFNFSSTDFDFFREIGLKSTRKVIYGFVDESFFKVQKFIFKRPYVVQIIFERYEIVGFTPADL